MSLKDILVHIDDRKTSAGRLAAALALAESHGAHLTGLYILQRPYIPAYAEAQIDSRIIEMQREQALKTAAEAKAAFEKATGTGNVVAEWRQVEGDGGEQLALHGRYADLIVISQSPEDLIFQRDDLPDRLVMEAGRPLLVLPREGKVASLGNKVLVAWDGSERAARAVHDALPILEQAEQVTVVSVDPKSKPSLSDELSAADLAHHLARHDVNVTSEHAERQGSVAETLTKRAQELGCDLLVMGAYGHARVSEIVLGGVSRSMIDEASMPVLMSH